MLWCHQLVYNIKGKIHFVQWWLIWYTKYVSKHNTTRRLQKYIRGTTDFYNNKTETWTNNKQDVWYNFKCNSNMNSKLNPSPDPIIMSNTCRWGRKIINRPQVVHDINPDHQPCLAQGGNAGSYGRVKSNIAILKVW